MCRDKAHGGRRCPGGMTQARRNQINARRREVYKQRKEQSASVDSTMVIPTAVSPNASNETTTTELLRPEWARQSLSTQPDSSQMIHHDSLGVTEQPVTGTLAESGYFSHKHVSGKLNPEALNGDSYKVFGFEEPDTQGYVRHLKERTDENYDSWFSDCQKEGDAANLTQSEKNAVQLYTGSVYAKVNYPLRGVKTLVDTPSDESIDMDSFVTLDSRIYGNGKDMSPQLLQKMTTELDSALSKGPGVQRVVYRGLSDAGLSESGMTRSQLLRKFEIGKEVVFDDYQSSSLSGEKAMEFSEKRGVMFEIMTPDGLLVEQWSAEGAEMEVLLPRGSKYITVGRHQWQAPTSRSTVDIVQLVAVDDEGYVREQSRGIFEASPLKDSQLQTK